MKRSFRQSAAPIAAVAVAAAFLVAGCGSSAAPSRTPAATAASQAPSPSPVPLPATGALDEGTYYIAAGPFSPARVTFSVPAGWATDDGFVTKKLGQPGELALSTWVVTHVHADSCYHTTDTLVDVGSSPDKLVSTLVALKNRVVSPPTDVTLAGIPAKRLELSVPADLDVSTCTFGAIKNWPDPGPDESGGLCCGGPGHVDVVYVVDIKGKPLAVVARHLPGSSAQDLAELHAIVDSMKIEF